MSNEPGLSFCWEQTEQMANESKITTLVFFILNFNIMRFLIRSEACWEDWVADQSCIPDDISLERFEEVGKIEFSWSIVLTWHSQGQGLIIMKT